MLAAALTLKMAAFAPSINFLDFFMGIGLYSFFSANFNTEAGAWDSAKTCHENTHRMADLVELAEC